MSDPIEEQVGRYLAEGRAEDAWDLLLPAVVGDMFDPVKLALAVECQLALDEPEEAMTYVRLLLREAPSLALSHTLAARVALALGRTADMESHLTQARRLDPNDLDAASIRAIGGATLRSRSLGAIDAQRISPGSRQALLGGAFAASRAGLTHRALDHLVQLNAAHPDDEAGNELLETIAEVSRDGYARLRAGLQLVRSDLAAGARLDADATLRAAATATASWQVGVAPALVLTMMSLAILVGERLPRIGVTILVAVPLLLAGGVLRRALVWVLDREIQATHHVMIARAVAALATLALVVGVGRAALTHTDPTIEVLQQPWWAAVAVLAWAAAVTWTGRRIAAVGALLPSEMAEKVERAAFRRVGWSTSLPLVVPIVLMPLAARYTGDRSLLIPVLLVPLLLAWSTVAVKYATLRSWSRSAGQIAP